jgi:hypothetical protein
VIKNFPQADKFAIWFKGSPVNPIEPLFNELGIGVNEANYKIFHKDISELLKLTFIALIPNTTVAIEAVAFGCTIIIPVLADTMLMNPIVDTEAEYFIASTADEFKSIVENNIQQKHMLSHSLKSKSFIENYWNIDMQLPLWNEILSS